MYCLPLLLYHYIQLNRHKVAHCCVELYMLAVCVCSSLLPVSSQLVCAALGVLNY